MGIDLLADRVAIVSGVGPGLGRDIALALAEAGADVVLAARNPDRLDAVAEEVEALGRRAVTVPTDITDRAACQNLIDVTKAEFGKLHTLVNSAFMQPPFNHIVDAAEEEFRQSFEVNVFGHAWLTQAAVPLMRESGPSSIVFINTLSTRRIRENFGIYTSSKMALLGMAKVLAVELGSDKIRVNSVHPGYIWGDSVKFYFNHLAKEQGRTFDEVYDDIAKETALYHLPGSDEIAQSVVFFASEKMSSSITGESIDVNAGQWIR